MSDKPVNAVDKRLKMLNGLWAEFTELPDARLLRWCVAPDSQRVVETFLEVHKEDPDGVPHLFFFSEIPFAGPDGFADQLVKWFCQYYEDNREGITEEGGDDTWKCPVPPGGKGGLEYMLQVLGSFQTHYKDLFGILVLAMIPKDIADSSAWIQWLKRLMALPISPHLRFLVVDDINQPVLAELAKADPKKIVTQTPDIDMPAIYRELLKESGGSGPGVFYRKQFVEMMLKGQAGDLAGAKAHAEAALKIATENQWPQMQIVVHMGLAGMVFGAGDKAQALDLYKTATATAEKAAEQGDAVAPKLIVQARMAQASVFLSDQKLKEAGELYLGTAPLAEAGGDSFQTMENYRMAAYCLEQAKDPERSWACATKALDAAAQIPTETRVQTLLHHVGHSMMRLAKKAPFTAQEKATRQRLVELIGADWEKKTP